VFLLTWAADLDAPEAAALARRLNLDRGARRMLEGWPATLDSLQRPGGPPPRLSADQIAAAAASAREKSRRRALERLLGSPLPVLSIGGRDLVRAGVPAGPAIGRALARTEEARRCGEIPRERELEYALAIAREDAS
jgi:hypothetical protein